ncbi:hypothetical protein AKJ57_05710 [candidate division MSBL1 archaeon SCGC-AAA259A05]|uniref:Adenylate kinase n=1 Tax=candidate division MSBL1 archaeon SCGC-AAA259A05 TaxID=1698259 RepID=A0A133U4T2_9EURY|nr:hypothetical protein AKJ57_05710 [candidate division MSBL1 archaeon SCGC-AAA259A05]
MRESSEPDATFGELVGSSNLPIVHLLELEKIGTRGELYQREDDRPKVIKRRLNTYEERSQPIIDYYREKNTVKDVVAREEKPVEEMMEEIYTAIEETILHHNDHEQERCIAWGWRRMSKP